MRTNVPPTPLYTHEGGTAGPQRPLQELTRAVASCLLLEDTFYEKGSELASRIQQLCSQVSPEELAGLARRARDEWKLRHLPLFLVRQMVGRKGNLVGTTLAHVIQRPDELAEFLALYWKEGKVPIAAQVKKGLAHAFTKFTPYELAKWNRASTIKLRDVLFLCHAKPKDAEQAEAWKKLVDGTLETPDTWEVALSKGADKRETFERLLLERKLGYIALLMNLRNMVDVGVKRTLIEEALLRGAKGSRALPFRFVSAARYAPSLADTLSSAMRLAIPQELRLNGETVVVVDVSGSMSGRLSSKGEATRAEAASALAVLIREIAPVCRVFSFSQNLVEVPNYTGLALVKAIGESQHHSSTFLAAALFQLKARLPEVPHRLIIITDEQSHDGIIPAWSRCGYLLNVGPYKPGLDVSQGWTRISGWSERVIEWLICEEAQRGE